MPKNTKLVQSGEIMYAPTNAGKGRKKGSVNKIPKAVKEMILNALDQVGGEAYLVEQAHANPVAFLTLLGKVLPLDFKANLDGKLSINVITGIDRHSFIEQNILERKSSNPQFDLTNQATI
jgi:hypothetical protein